MDDVRMIRYLRRKAAGADADASVLNRAWCILTELQNGTCANTEEIVATGHRLRVMAANVNNSMHIMEATADRLEELAERVAIMEEGNVTSDMAGKITAGIDIIYGLLYMARVMYRSSSKVSPELDTMLQTLSKQVDDVARNMACIITCPEDAAQLCLHRWIMVMDECGR